jgi:flavin reductase (DIM6/NTAB) family NADH-FMN oxidoreductase RutF
VLVTTEDTDSIKTRRGLTVSSFTTICLTPSPFVCFSTRQSSRSADLIARRQRFVIHLLSCTKESAKIADAFSKSDLAPHASQTFTNPFELGKWMRHDQWNMPVLDGVVGALLCKVDKTVDVGDHRLWIAEVEDLAQGRDDAALSYCGRKYRGEGRPLFPHDTSEE